MRRIVALLILTFSVLTASAAMTENSDKPKAYLVANAHFDTQWRWDIRRSIAEFLPNTIEQNFALFERYPDYVFNFESAVKYAWIKEYYPDKFEKVKRYVREGRWHLSGSSWEAADPLIPSTESLFRNILLGQEFFEREFGTKSTDIMLPDCFGFGYILPTVAAHCGLIGFSTQKLEWRHTAPHNGKKYPFEYGIWRGIDGSEIIAAPNGGGYGWNPTGDLTCNEELAERSRRAPKIFRYYGTRSSEMRADRGGSPLPRTVKTVERALCTDGPIDIISAESDRLMRDLLESGDCEQLPVYDGEMLMDVHGTGCYTSQSAMKRYNRTNEILAEAAERSSVIAEIRGLLPYPAERLNDAWRKVVLHQFHDDLTGTSISDAYRFSWNDELLAREIFAETIESACGRIIGEMDTDFADQAVVLFNYNGTTYNGQVEATVDAGSAKSFEVRDGNGAKTDCQCRITDGRAKIRFNATIPSMGFAVYRLRRTQTTRRNSKIKIESNSIENSVYRLTLDPSGDICSLYDKRADRELVAEGRFFGLELFEENKSDRWPAWEILKEVIDRKPLKIDGCVRIDIHERGPLRSTLKVTRRTGGSTIVQYISLSEGADADRVDIATEIDWNSRRSLLKAAFPTSINAEKARYDLGIGSIERGNNNDGQYEVYAQEWVDMTTDDSSYGVAVFSDSKYGWDKPADGEIRLTLLHTPTADGGWFPQQSEIDLGVHRFSYSIIGHCGNFRKAEIPRRAAEYNRQPIGFLSGRHKGVLGRSYSALALSGGNANLRLLKKAEDGNGYIVRTYETDGSSANATLRFAGGIACAEVANGLEERVNDATVSNGSLRFETAPFAPQTFRIHPADMGPLRTVEQQQLRLPYNANVISSDAFVATAKMDSMWNSYSGELIGRKVIIDGIEYDMGEADYQNAVRCKGQTLAIPEGYSTIHILAASADENGSVDTLLTGGSAWKLEVPYYSGFYGSWGWKGISAESLREAPLAHVGTHSHNPYRRNEPYRFTYIYRFEGRLPDDATTIELPDDENLVVFAVTVSKSPINPSDRVTPLCRLM